jgi:ribosomal protein L7/L12
MKSGAMIFLGTLGALSVSWLGMVFLPNAQVGSQTPENAEQLSAIDSRTNWIARQRGLPHKAGGSGAVYPSPRPGLAQLGAEVYRANGCAYCHTRQVRQTGTTYDVVLLDAGTNGTSVARVIRELRSNSNSDAANALEGLPKSIFANAEKAFADSAQKTLGKVGAKVEVVVVPLGPDVARGWGVRQTVAQDYLYDHPVLLGSQRVGPDLANVGARISDVNWHLRHLYNPRLDVKKSTMPPFRFLFEKRKIRENSPSSDALQLDSVPAGFEIVPTKEAKALAAYLVSLRADAPLWETPMSLPRTASPSTNAPGTETPTNVPATNAGFSTVELLSVSAK